MPVLVRYKCLGRCRPAADERRHNEPKNTRKARFFAECDLSRLEAIDQATLPHWFPDVEFLRGYRYQRDALWNYGVDRFADLYTKRNLWALAAWLAALRRIRESTAAVETLALAFTGVSMGVSRMNRYVPYATFPFYLTMGTYYLPQISCHENATPHLRGKVIKIRASHAAAREAASTDASMLSCESAAELSLQEASLDYLFTDPPYVHKVQYGELNFVWESWLGFDGGWLKDEIVVNPFRAKSLDDWDRDMRKAMANCFRALKPGRWLSLCYHDTEPETWARIQNIVLDTGFEIHTVTVLDPKQKSQNQLFAEKVVKSDLVINCRKPRPGETRVEGQDEVGLVSRRVRDILIDTLSTAGGQPRDKLWDLVLKRLLTRGQMAEHRFEDILAGVALKSESGRWFLKEEFEALSDSDLHNEEAAGAVLEQFARLRCMGVPVALAARLTLDQGVGADMTEEEIEKDIRRNLLNGVEAQAFRLGGRLKGCEFYDCLFFYLTRYLKGRAAGRIPRRNLAEFLEEYLVRFRDGQKWLYRPPNDAESAALKKSRQSGLGRRIRRYVAFLTGEGEFPAEKRPDARTLVVWLKHCAVFGLADEGVALFEKGGLMGELSQLPEDDRYDVEDYYARCKRHATKHEELSEEAEDSEAEGETTEDAGK